MGEGAAEARGCRRTGPRPRAGPRSLYEHPQGPGRGLVSTGPPGVLGCQSGWRKAVAARNGSM